MEAVLYIIQQLGWQQVFLTTFSIIITYRVFRMLF